MSAVNAEDASKNADPGRGEAELGCLRGHEVDGVPIGYGPRRPQDIAPGEIINERFCARPDGVREITTTAARTTFVSLPRVTRSQEWSVSAPSLRNG